MAFSTSHREAQTTFTALDAASGTARWIYTGISTFSDPAVGGGHVYTASLDGNLYAFPTDCVGNLHAHLGGAGRQRWERTRRQPSPKGEFTLVDTTVAFTPSTRRPAPSFGRRRSTRLTSPIP